jgi:hypothetical protein
VAWIWICNCLDFNTFSLKFWIWNPQASAIRKYPWHTHLLFSTASEIHIHYNIYNYACAPHCLLREIRFIFF